MNTLALILAIVACTTLFLVYTLTDSGTEVAAELDVQRHQQVCARLAEATGTNINLISFGGRDCGEKPTYSTFASSEN